MPAPQRYSTRMLRDLVGHAFAVSAPIPVDEERINALADVPRDQQWIAITYGLDNIRFIGPAPAGKRVIAGCNVTEIEEQGPNERLSRFAATLNVEGLGKSALVGGVLAMG